jgi:hypothetical protein
LSRLAKLPVRSSGQRGKHAQLLSETSAGLVKNRLDLQYRGTREIILVLAIFQYRAIEHSIDALEGRY